MIGKERLVFDPADASDGDIVAGYLYGADGTLITTTNSGGKDALDVYFANSSIAVTATDLDIRDLDHASDSVKVGDGTEFLAINADGSINITDNGGSLTVDATDLDIRDLDAAQDNVAISDGTDTLAINGDGSINATVSATDLDIRDLSHTSDSVALGDGTSLFTSTTVGADIGLDVNILNDIAVDLDGVYNGTTNTNPDNVGLILHTRAASPGDAEQGYRSTGASPSSDNVDPANVHASDVNSFAMGWDGAAWDRLTATAGALDVNLASSDIDLDVSDTADTALANGADSVGVTAVAVSSGLANRKFLYYQNLGNKSVYIGGASVSTTNGLRLSPGSVAELRLGPSVSLYAISTAAAQDTRYLELS